MEFSLWRHGALEIIPDYVRHRPLRIASLIDNCFLHSGTWVRTVPVDAEGTVVAVIIRATPSAAPAHGSTCTFLLGDAPLQTLL